MENHNFSSLYAAKLPINSLYSLNKSTIELAKPIIKEIGTIPAAALTKLENVNLSLGAAMNKSLKSGFTSEMKTLNKDRKSDISVIKSVTSSYLKSNDPLKKADASAMHLFLEPYWGVDSFAQDVQTGIVSEMLIKYNARPELLAAAQRLGIDTLFTSLGVKNDAFDIKFKSRNTEYAERETSASDIKPDAVTVYIQFCTCIEQACNLTPNDTLIALFHKMDELRKVYHGLEGGKDTPATPESK